jgi:hypothetical protein
MFFMVKERGGGSEGSATMTGNISGLTPGPGFRASAYCGKPQQRYAFARFGSTSAVKSSSVRKRQTVRWTGG